MYVSRFSRKLFAVVLTAALMISCVSMMSEKKVSAADTASAPEVKFLGATLLSKSEDGKQKLRLGIQVTNASYARGCGIKLRIKNNENPGSFLWISTKNGGGSKIHDLLCTKDAEKDYVTYAVVINNIPLDSIDTMFEIIGTVTDFSDNTLQTKADDASDIDARSVNTIVDSMGQSYGKSIFMLTEGEYAGSLVYKVDDLPMDENAFPKTAVNGTNFALRSGDIDGVSYAATSNYATDAENGDYYTITTCQGINDLVSKGLGFQPPEDTEYLLKFDVKAQDGTAVYPTHYFDWATTPDYSGKDSVFVCNDTWQTCYMMYRTNFSGDSIYISASKKTDNGYTFEDCSYDIKNFTIYKLLTDLKAPDINVQEFYEVDFSDTVMENGWLTVTKLDEDGFLLVDTNVYESGTVVFNNPVNLDEYSKCVLEGYFIQETDKADSVNVTLMGDIEKGVIGESFPISIDLEELKDGSQKNCSSIRFGPGKFGVYGTKCKITSIKFIKNAVLPVPPEGTSTPAATETPEPTSTPAVTETPEPTRAPVTGDKTVSLAADNFVIGGENAVYNEDGSVSLSISNAYGGLGVAFNLDESKADIDLSEYSSVVLSITSDAVYPTIVSLASDVVDIWNMKQKDSMYYDLQNGENEITLNITESQASAVFLKYNAWQEGNPESMNITINSITLKKK